MSSSAPSIPNRVVSIRSKYSSAPAASPPYRNGSRPAGAPWFSIQQSGKSSAQQFATSLTAGTRDIPSGFHVATDRRRPWCCNKSSFPAQFMTNSIPTVSQYAMFETETSTEPRRRRSCRSSRSSRSAPESRRARRRKGPPSSNPRPTKNC
jgi:hypothetical protein